MFELLIDYNSLVLDTIGDSIIEWVIFLLYWVEYLSNVKKVIKPKKSIEAHGKTQNCCWVSTALINSP